MRWRGGGRVLSTSLMPAAGAFLFILPYNSYSSQLTHNSSLKKMVQRTQKRFEASSIYAHEGNRLRQLESLLVEGRQAGRQAGRSSGKRYNRLVVFAHKGTVCLESTAVVLFARSQDRPVLATKKGNAYLNSSSAFLQ